MKISPTRILVPTDFSPASDRAISLAKEIAKGFDAEIHVLHVRVLLDDPSVDSEILDEVERILTTSEPATQAALERAGRNGLVPIHSHIERGIAAAPVIIDAVSEHDCDLVIMGTHGRRGLNRLLIGSVAQEVAHRSPVPVLTIRAEVSAFFRPQKILVAVDFSEYSLEAVKYAGVWASALEAELVLLHVVQPMVYPEFYAVDDLPEEHRERIVKRCHESLADAATKYLGEAPFTTAVVEGHVASAVSRFADENNIDLVVLATSGVSGLTHFVLGSAAERVVRLSKVPVLTVRVDS